MKNYLWAVILTLIMIVITGCGPTNEIYGKKTKVKSDINITNAEGGVIYFNPGLSTTSGNLDSEGDATAEDINNLKDLATLAYPGSNLNKGGHQEKPKATVTKTETTETVTQTTTPAVIPAPLPIEGNDKDDTKVDDVIDEGETPAGAKTTDAYHHYFPSGDGTEAFENTASFMVCPGAAKWEWCKMNGTSLFSYRGQDHGRHFWIFPASRPVNENSFMLCGSGQNVVKFEIGNGREGDHGLYGTCK